MLPREVTLKVYIEEMNPFARPQEEVLNDIEAICREPGFVHVLASLVFENNFHAVRVEEMYPKIQDQFNYEKLIRSELSVLHGLMLKGGVDLTPLSSEKINEFKKSSYALLTELHEGFYSQVIRSGSFLENPEGLLSRSEVIREAVFYAADSAFYFQQLSFSNERYAADSKWLKDNVGFTIAEAAHITGAIIANTHISAQALVAGYFGEIHDENTLKVFSISVDTICQMTEYKEVKVRCFLDKFSVGSDPSNERYKSVDGYNLGKSHPILMLDEDNLCLLQSHSLCESLYVSPTFWMNQDVDYKPTATANRGRHLEEKIVARLVRVFGEKRVFQNVEIYRGKTRVGEIDALVVYSDRTIVVQAKTKTLTLKAQQGDSAVLEDDFGKSIQSAYDQALVCSHEILKGGARFQLETGEAVDLQSDFVEIFPLCVVADHYPSLYFQARQFLKTQDHKIIRPPYVMDLFLLDVITEFLTHPIRMLDYLNKRTQYNDSVSSNNDFAVLGYHLEHNLYKGPENDLMVFSEDIAYQLDKAFTARRVFGDMKAVPKGVLTEFEGTPYGGILNYLENITEIGAVDLGYFLLSLNGASIDGINKGINQLSRNARKSDRTHDLSIGGSFGGMTYHLSAIPSERRIEKLIRHAELRKYSSKANIWFGLSATIGSDTPIDTICFLSSKWRPSSAMDAVVKQIPSKPSKLSNVTGRVIDKMGRNDKCHCGSDKKYKKCCLTSDKQS